VHLFTTPTCTISLQEIRCSAIIKCPGRVGGRSKEFAKADSTAKMSTGEKMSTNKKMSVIALTLRFIVLTRCRDGFELPTIGSAKM
jgi:hypothetical protein